MHHPLIHVHITMFKCSRKCFSRSYSSRKLWKPSSNYRHHISSVHFKTFDYVFKIKHFKLALKKISDVKNDWNNLDTHSISNYHTKHDREYCNLIYFWNKARERSFLLQWGFYSNSCHFHLRAFTFVHWCDLNFYPSTF